MDKIIIHNRIRELRFKAGEMTQQALAERVGITRQTVIALEKGKYYPSLELAFRIARTFAIPLGEIFEVADTAPKKIKSKKRTQ
ncbi:MAG: helix-turn-helix transcriptional regulator [Mariniblastus sp.]